MGEFDFFEQLPKADRNSELEQLSLNAFNSALPADRFLFRDERINDAGVDGSLELKINSRYTNLRAQVQLKSTDSADTNEDGSVSVQVDVANLNYLLMGASPLYVLFVVPRNELRFAWARDERKRLDQTNSDWAHQKHITIRFNNLLDTQAIEQIHERIQKEARLQGQISDTLSTASHTESVVVSIDPETLSITDPDKAERILLSSGTIIVTAGYPEKVRSLARLLDLKAVQQPRILLVRAYAEYVLARYQSAYALLAEATLHRNELSASDQQFLDFLRDGCDHQAGKITLHELAERLERGQPFQEGPFADSHRVEQLRYKALLDRDPVSQGAVVDELRSLVAAIIKDTNTSQVFKLFARSSLLEAEGFRTTEAAHREIGDARLKLAIGSGPDIPKMLRNHSEQFKLWEKEIISLVRDATRIGHPNLVAQATLQKAVGSFQFLANQRSFSLFFDLPMPPPEAVVRSLIEEVERAGRIYAHANQLEGELRAEMVKTDFLELIGEEAEAKRIARSVLPKAQAMDYQIIVSRAEDHLSGQGFRSKQDSVFAEKTEEQKVVRNANRSDEESFMYAAQALGTMDLPGERLPVVEREYFSLRDVAREQLSWCRHIDRLNDERHTWHPSTTYKRDPNRICICNLHKFESQTPNPDWKALSVVFKKTYCENCPDRNPIQTQSDVSQ